MSRKGIIDVSIDEEKRLVKLAQEGDRDVLNSLIIKYIPYVETRALKYVSYGMEKDDMVQEGLVFLYDLIMDYKDEEYKTRFRTYVNREIDRFFQKMIADNNLISSKKFREEISNNDEFVPKVMYLEDVIRDYKKEELTDGREDPVFDEVMLNWVYDYIDILVKRGELNDNQVKIIQLYFWDQMSFQEIGDLIGCTRSAVCKSIHKILNRMIYCVNHVAYVKAEKKEEMPFDWNQVWELVDNVPMSIRDREILKLYYEDGLIYDELALRFEVSATTARSIVERSLERIEEFPVKESLMKLLDNKKTLKDGLKKKRVMNVKR